MAGLEARGRAAGEAAAERARERVAAALREEVRGAAVAIEGGNVVVSGRRAPLDDPALLWVGGLLR